MEAQRLTEEQLDAYRPLRIWKSIDADRRRAAAEAFWKSDLVKDLDKAATIEVLAAAMHFRPQSIRTAPHAKKAGYLAGCNALNDHATGTLLYVYHFERQVPLMERFLDALTITHEGGRIEEENIAPQAEEALRGAVEGLLGEFGKEDVHLYLRTLVSQDEITWGALVPILESWES